MYHTQQYKNYTKYQKYAKPFEKADKTLFAGCMVAETTSAYLEMFVKKTFYIHVRPEIVNTKCDESKKNIFKN